MPLDATLGLVLAAALGPSGEWTAPPGCPGRAQVLEQAGAWIGGPVDEAGVELRGVLAAAPGGFVLDIEIRTPSGTTRKTARADDCRVLGSVAALMVAVAVDPVQTNDALRRGPPAAGERPPGLAAAPAIPEPPEALAVEGTVTRPREPEPARRTASEADAVARPRAPLRGFVRVSGSIGSGIVPALDGGLAVGTGLLAPYLRAELVGFHVLARTARYPAPSSAGASVAAWGGSLRVGPRVRIGAVELHALAGVAVAALTASGFGARNSRTNVDSWAALALVPGVRWEPIPWLAVGGDLEVEAALRRPAFAVSGSPELYRAARRGLRGSVVVELRFGNRRAG